MEPQTTYDEDDDDGAAAVRQLSVITAQDIGERLTELGEALRCLGIPLALVVGGMATAELVRLGNRIDELGIRLTKERHTVQRMLRFAKLDPER